jgi:hypothetical protein
MIVLDSQCPSTEMGESSGAMQPLAGWPLGSVHLPPTQPLTAATLNGRFGGTVPLVRTTGSGASQNKRFWRNPEWPLCRSGPRNRK